MNFIDAIAQAKQLGPEGVIIKRPHHRPNQYFILHNSGHQLVLRQAEQNKLPAISVESIMADDWEVVDLNSSNWKQFYTVAAVDGSWRVTDKSTGLYAHFDTQYQAMMKAIELASAMETNVEALLLNKT